jgi:hypothetical protein
VPLSLAMEFATQTLIVKVTTLMKEIVPAALMELFLIALETVPQLISMEMHFVITHHLISTVPNINMITTLA